MAGQKPVLFYPETISARGHFCRCEGRLVNVPGDYALCGHRHQLILEQELSLPSLLGDEQQ